MYIHDSLSDEFAKADKSIQRKRLPRCNNGRVGANQLLWDFGVDNPDIYNEKTVQRKIGQIEERYNLVMILEQFQVFKLWDQAIEQANIALEKNPKHRGAMMCRALVFINKKEYANATKELTA